MTKLVIEAIVQLSKVMVLSYQFSVSNTVSKIRI